MKKEDTSAQSGPLWSMERGVYLCAEWSSLVYEKRAYFCAEWSSLVYERA